MTDGHCVKPSVGSRLVTAVKLQCSLRNRLSSIGTERRAHRKCYMVYYSAANQTITGHTTGRLDLKFFPIDVGTIYTLGIYIYRIVNVYMYAYNTYRN